MPDIPLQGLPSPNTLAVFEFTADFGECYTTPSRNILNELFLVPSVISIQSLRLAKGIRFFKMTGNQLEGPL